MIAAMSTPKPIEDTRRVAFNEVASRRINELIAPPPEAGWDLGLVERRCECGDAACDAPVALTVAEYEELRTDARRFAIVHDHVFHPVEQVVERRERFTVVEKVAEAAAIAEAHDPRSQPSA